MGQQFKRYIKHKISTQTKCYGGYYSLENIINILNIYRERKNASDDLLWQTNKDNQYTTYDYTYTTGNYLKIRYQRTAQRCVWDNL